MKIKTKFILTFTIVILGTIILKKTLPKNINDYKVQKEYFWINKTHSNHKANIIIAGDSRIYRGFSTKDFLKGLNKKTTALNIGYSSAGYGKKYFDFINSKLDNRIDSTKILLLGITPNSLTYDASQNKHFEGYYKKRKLDIFQSTYIDPNISFYPYTIYEILKSQKDTLDYNHFFKLPKHKKEYFNTDGWVASTSTDIDSLNALKSYKKSFTKKNIDSTIVKNLFFQIKEWNHQGVKVFCFRPPTTKHMVDLENELSGFNEHLFKKELLKNGGIWINIHQTKYLSYDGSHLDYRAAKEFSRDMGKKIKFLLN